MTTRFTFPLCDLEKPCTLDVPDDKVAAYAEAFKLLGMDDTTMGPVK